jgi:TATA-box binding protein (TBP) (component of TFIID and TFIIIB)
MSMVSTATKTVVVVVIKTSHIKAHINLKGLPYCIDQLRCSLSNRSKKAKRTRNIVVVREKFTWTIFPSCGFVNVTNIKNWDDVDNVIPSFANSFDISERDIINRLTIDNSTSTIDSKRPINLIALQNIFAQLDLRRSSFPLSVFEFDRDIFPGAFFKSKQCGTIVVFGSGKLNVMGATCLNDIKMLYQFIHRLVSVTYLH